MPSILLSDENIPLLTLKDLDLTALNNLKVLESMGVFLLIARINLKVFS